MIEDPLQHDAMASMMRCDIQFGKNEMITQTGGGDT
jgi:hypothetical protein